MRGFISSPATNLMLLACPERFLFSLQILESLKNHDGYGDENVASKYNLELF